MTTLLQVGLRKNNSSHALDINFGHQGWNLKKATKFKRPAMHQPSLTWIGEGHENICKLSTKKQTDNNS